MIAFVPTYRLHQIARVDARVLERWRKPVKMGVSRAKQRFCIGFRHGLRELVRRECSAKTGEAYDSFVYHGGHWQIGQLQHRYAPRAIIFVCTT